VVVRECLWWWSSTVFWKIMREEISYFPNITWCWLFWFTWFDMCRKIYMVIYKCRKTLRCNDRHKAVVEVRFKSRIPFHHSHPPYRSAINIHYTME
jgi:hypothetical protein